MKLFENLSSYNKYDVYNMLDNFRLRGLSLTESPFHAEISGLSFDDDGSLKIEVFTSVNTPFEQGTDELCLIFAEDELSTCDFPSEYLDMYVQVFKDLLYAVNHLCTHID